MLRTGATNQVLQWDPSEFAISPNPRMDAIFDSAGGYLTEDNELIFKVFLRVRAIF